LLNKVATQYPLFFVKVFMNNEPSSRAPKKGKATTAALLSAFVFPGAGLWWLKHYWRACIFIIPTGLIVMYFTRLLWQLLAPIQHKLQRQVESGAVDPFDLTGLYVRMYKEVFLALESHQGELDFIKYVVIACWLCSILSSYFAGKKIEQSESDNARG
jgi:hypothetical protein